MTKKHTALLEKYPWLSITTTIEDYVDPTYYNRLLKPYRFNGKDDLAIFEDFLTGLPKIIPSALELGPGTGRVTDIATRNKDIGNLTLIDLSPVMISYLKSKLHNANNISFQISDSLTYLEKADGQYDLIYSLWSFSHSIHQLLSRTDFEKARTYVLATLEKTLRDNLIPGGSFYLIHFDTDSEEQKILLRQWGRKYPFYNRENRNPSRTFIEEALLRLEREGIIELSITHLKGDPITYESIDQALEIFLNFHLESHFNEQEYVDEIIDEMKQYFAQFTDENGVISIRPACYEYRAKKRAS